MSYTRRQILISLGTSALVLPNLAIPKFAAGAEMEDVTKALTKAPRAFTEEQEQILSSATERLLPGAKEARVLEYINYWLSKKPFQSVRNYIAHGARYLDGMAKKQYKRTFISCASDQQDNILQAFTAGKVKVGKFDGALFFQQLMELTLEGFLSDPKYGGNYDRAGWRFIGIPDGLGSCWWNPKGVEMVLDPDKGFND